MADFVNLDLKELNQLEKDIMKLSGVAFPIAVRETLNNAAFDTRTRTRIKIERKMINRNKYTVNSIRVDKTGRTLRISEMESVVGSIAPYMDDQEFGGTKTKKGKHGVPIPTTTASGESRGAVPRKKAVKRRNRLANIVLDNKTSRFKSKKQEIFVRTLLAVRSGNKELYLNTGSRQAIYRIKGRGKLNKQGRITGVKMNMLYDLTNKSITIPKTTTLGPATKETEAQMPFMYKKNLQFQIKRHNLFRGKP